jgi:hypothetical protein
MSRKDITNYVIDKKKELLTLRERKKLYIVYYNYCNRKNLTYKKYKTLLNIQKVSLKIKKRTKDAIKELSHGIEVYSRRLKLLRVYKQYFLKELLEEKEQ